MAGNAISVTLRVLLAMSLLGLVSCAPAEKQLPSEDPPNTIGPEGGTVTVDDPQSSINGLSIEVPKGSYPQKTTFKISAKPYAGKKIDGLNPITPVIHVDSGGKFSAKVMKVTIPITLPENSFAMGFFVRPDGTLEGMPIAALSRTSITVATRHFSEFLISMIANIKLPEQVTTGFAPGKDDWQFPNYGSFIAPDGHCAGQAISALWYYCEKAKKGESSLYGLYDNNGAEKTPPFWEDDSWGYRLASALQEDLNYRTKPYAAFYDLAKDSPYLTWKAFLYSMHLTKEPQCVVIYDVDQGGGHALVAYAADAKLGLLRVADPNYPGNKTKWIAYMNGAFVPYISASSAKAVLAGKTSSYELVVYHAATAVTPWSKIAARWKELKDGSVGHDRFPSYGLMQPLKGGSGFVPIPDRMKTTKESVEVLLSPSMVEPARIRVYKDGKKIAEGEKVKLPLDMGINKFGFLVQGEKNNSWEWVDYTYLTIERIEEKKQEDEDNDAPKPKPVYDAVINGVYYGEVQSKTRRRGPMLYVTDATGKYPLRTAYRIVSEKTDSFGNVTETHFQFKRGFGSPGVPPGKRRVCVGTVPGRWSAKSEIINVGQTGTHKVTLGTPPRK